MQALLNPEAATIAPTNIGRPRFRQWIYAALGVWLLTSVLEPKQLSHQTAGHVYRWRWRNEGLFREYKRLLQKVKLSSRTVALVHREAEGSLLALQLLLALAVQTPAGQPVALPGSPRRELLRLRGAITAALINPRAKPAADN